MSSETHSRPLPPAGTATERYPMSQVFSLKAVSAGTVAALFGCTGPALVVINAAEAGQLSNGQTVAWLFAIYVLGGLISLYMALRYRQPICGAYSIPGAAILISALGGMNFADATGAFIMAGALVLLLGVTGVIGKLMRWLPIPIVMAMIAGAMIRFATGAVDSVSAAPLMAGAAALAFFLAMRFTRRIPPVLAAVVVGLVMALAMGMVTPKDVDIAFVMPAFTMPHFTFDAFLAISIPLAALVIGAENAQATGVLIAEKYDPPVNAMTVISGLGGMLAGLLGGHNANIAGPMTAICSSDQAGDNPRTRYGATLVNGTLFALFGLFAGIAVPFITALPKELILVVAGLAMLGVLLTSLQQAFQKGSACQIGAFVALAVAMSNLSLLGVSAPFWALVIGVAVSWLLGEMDR
ncbi:benzoate transporter [Pseudomonas daroniae]|uniref:Benzoate transporter n=1 Tax=Phytopseudomonas daroniae TaxID=2487519 RepID=A0A4Q9QKM4_9GAMM|nr:MULTISPECIES: benzoate/H(+) symporter BenE family transporter [Pseudomonas]TBU72854.1 benzoate transporter [Pseudomonas daroniae]TBU79340.1 benzoate transporter [Pseudomonas daroniae]TBU80122.1 benzoate transporter [Pseudomonas sp. FRB 228]TBU91440.1 benzoate transporter [Pseudomonas daroniae]